MGSSRKAAPRIMEGVRVNEYDLYVQNILDFGTKATPRGLGVTTLKNMHISVPTGMTYRRYKDNPLIGFMEGLQFMGGVFNHSELKRAAPHAKLDLFGHTSSYGLRVGEQANWIINELNADWASRRAILVLANPNEVLEDRPCTTCMQFFITDTLNTTVTMRSSDAVYGLPYDFIQFGMMSMMIANCLNIDVGNTTINIGDAHIYDDTASLAKDFEEWVFTIPHLKSLVEYEIWAQSTMYRLDKDVVYDVFKFHKA